MGRRHQMPFGAEFVSDGVHFRLWAPKHDRISLNIVGDQHLHLMRAAQDGWHELTTVEVLGDGAVLVQWTLGDGSWLRLATNLSAKPVGAHRTGGREMLSIGSVEHDRLGAWSVVWSLRGG
jgi:1,4-alpha-glucan branching enzyme